MSYILDALKKSERQRPTGTVPDLFAVHGPQRPPPQRPTRAIVVSALLVVATAIVVGAWLGIGGRDETATAPHATVPPESAAKPRTVIPTESVTAPVVAATASTPVRLPQPIRPLVRDGAAARRPGSRLSQAPAPLLPATRRANTPAETTGSVPAPPPVAAVPAVVPQAAPAAMPAVASAVVPEVAPAVVPTAKPEAVAVPAVGMSAALIPAALPPPTVTPAGPPPAELAPEPPADGRVLDLAELPAPLRAEVPKLIVSGHVWSEEPSLRMMTVNDRLLHEGAEATSGVRLQEITPAGGVFVIKGWRFRVNGARQ